MNRDLPEVFEVDSRDPESRCAGGESFGNCETVRTFSRLFNLPESGQTKNGQESNLRYLKSQIFFPLGCVSCRQICEISLEVDEAGFNGEAILSSTDPETYANLPSTKLTEGFIKSWLSGDWSKGP